MKLTRLSFAIVPPGVLALSACTVFAASAAQLTLHQQDFGHQYAVHVGDTVKVDLLDTFGVPGSSTVWSADTSDASVLSRITTTRETPSSMMGSQAHYVATFKAQKAGVATIEMVGTARCEAMNPAFCPQPRGTIAITVA
jgi:predicted secreted protein